MRYTVRIWITGRLARLTGVQCLRSRTFRWRWLASLWAGWHEGDNGESRREATIVATTEEA